MCDFDKRNSGQYFYFMFMYGSCNISETFIIFIFC